MCGSINFRRGGGDVQVHLTYKNSDAFLALNLFYRSPMVTFKEKYHFPRFKVPGGFGGGLLIP